MPVGEWKDSAEFPGVAYLRLDKNYYAVGRWVGGTIREVDRLDRRNRGPEGQAGNPYRSEQTGQELKWAEHLQRIKLMRVDE